tara:strand:+ start:186 stop:359 length:174 start_codon:yes stop_codon:yes gene_type:complete
MVGAIMKHIKYILLGFVFGVLVQSCDSNLLQADSECYDYLGEQGSTEWNPIYVKIVD